MNDPIVQTKACHHCQSSFDITQWDIDFYAKISPKFGDYIAQIPTPTLCPACRQRRRLAFRNERNLYRTTCAASGKDIISIYSPDKEYVVYDQKIRRSDDRDPLDYGREFDSTRTFTEQFGELMGVVPHCSIINIGSENSDYTNISAYNKDSYLLIESSNNDTSLYGYWLQKSNHCVDCAMVNNSEQCYESIDIDDSYKLFFSEYCRNCSDSYLLENCTNCQYCLGCIGLDGKKHYVFNEQVSPEEFDMLVTQLVSGTQEQKQQLLDQRQSLRDQHSGYETIRSSQEVVDSHHVCDAGMVVSSCEIHDAQEVKYGRHVWFHSGDSMDVDTVGYNSFGMYECINTALDASKNSFCIRCRTGCHDLLYCFNCDSSSHLFGCVGLRNKEYCIFNKQYTKEEYNILVPKIIEHMKQTGERGEFFHPSLSPFGYNETVAQEYFTVESITAYQNKSLPALGYKWSTYELPQPQVDKIIPGEKLPSQGCATIREKQPSFLQDILRYAIRCESSQKLFRLIPQEIEFYTRHNLPLPAQHPDVRHMQRMERRK